MSKLKTPRAKKTASLTHDRRKEKGGKGNSRTAIPRAKARTRRTLRRTVHQALAHAEALSSDLELERAEKELNRAARDRQSEGFRKPPGVPLGEHLEGKGRRRRGE